MTKTKSPGPIKAGRPRKDATQAKFYDGKLYALLLPALPQHVEGGRLNPVKIAAAIEMHRYTVYKWLQFDKLSQKGANLLLKEADGRLKPEDLIKFVLA